jgi:hypothetical protein
LNKLEFSLLKDNLYQVWLNLTLWFWRRFFFFLNSVYFYSFAIISPWRRVSPFIWTNLNPLSPGWFVICLHVKIDPVVSEYKIFKWPHRIFIFLWLSPLWKGHDPLFVQTWIPFLQFKDNLHQVWLKLAHWFLRRFLDICCVFLLFRYYLLLQNLHVKKLESPPLKDDLYQVWFQLDQWFCRRSRKCKSLQIDRRTDGRRDRRATDNGRSEKLTWAFSSGELKKCVAVSRKWGNRLRPKNFRLLHYGLMMLVLVFILLSTVARFCISSGFTDYFTNHFLLATDLLIMPTQL